ncbi:hypothetical protein DFS34DRAFT_600667 [Phlyctochytrium arcticum]|nr:hypothetical protein DFS34DRAFT_600667 [Phlyctochytrium arcticum]
MPAATAVKNGSYSGSTPQEEDAAAYLAKNRVPQIMQQMLCATLFEQPDDPKEFMVRKLEEMRNARARGQALSVFTRTDFQGLFRIFDVTGRGYITEEQYVEAMKSIGAWDRGDQRPANGAESNRIRADTFVEDAIRQTTILEATPSYH